MTDTYRPSQEAKDRFGHAVQASSEIFEAITEVSADFELHPYEVLGVLSDYQHMLLSKINGARP